MIIRTCSVVAIVIFLAASVSEAADPGVFSPFRFMGDIGASLAQRFDVDVPRLRTGLTAEVGYAIPNVVRTELTCDVENVVQDYPSGGLWLGLRGDVGFTDRTAAWAGGTWMIPQHFEADEESLRFVEWRRANRKWDVHTQWYTLDGAFTYAVYPTLKAVGGLRFDSFTAFCSDPYSATPDVSSGSGDEADTTITTYTPFVGFLVDYGSTLRAGAIGFPRVPGRATHKETFGGKLRWEARSDLADSYFVEAFCEWRTDFPGGSLGLFGKWNYIHGTSFFYVESLGSYTDDFTLKLTFDRQNWILGGLVSFDLPRVF